VLFQPIQSAGRERNSSKLLLPAELEIRPSAARVTSMIFAPATNQRACWCVAAFLFPVGCEFAHMMRRDGGRG
jgi:hypothetical protein